MKPSILVTDGEQRAALAIVRSLGRRGHPVYVCSARGRSLAGASRFAREEARVPDALADPGRFVAAIERLVHAWGIRVLLPVTEASLLEILPARDRFPALCVPFPSAETFRQISDKNTVLGVARELGLAVPEQRVLDTRPADASFAATCGEFPLVIKPARSVAKACERRIALGVRHAADRESLGRALDELAPEAYPVLVQRRIAGPGVGIFLLLWEGELLAAFAHRRIREKPPSGGVSVYRESIPAEARLVAQSRALLERFGWHGVAMIEYKVDERTGTPYLMEVNGRFWGSLQLAVDAGVDFPALLVDAALGRPAAAMLEYRTGIRSRWWWGDVDHLLTRLRRSPTALDLPPEAGSRWRALRDFLVVRPRKDRNEILRLNDPRPFVRETADWIRTAFNGRTAT